MGKVIELSPTEIMCFMAMPLFERWVRFMVFAEQRGVSNYSNHLDRCAESLEIPYRWIGKWSRRICEASKR